MFANIKDKENEKRWKEKKSLCAVNSYRDVLSPHGKQEAKSK